jgi:hypothetical protein
MLPSPLNDELCIEEEEDELGKALLELDCLD